MKQWQKEAGWTLAAIVGILLIFFAMPAESHHIIEIDNSTVNNYYEGSDGGITGGLSDSEVAELLTVGAAAGSHQFDFSTQDWQGSVTGAWYDDEDAVSFGLAKRWDKLGQVLLHGNYTQNGSEDLWVIGGTFRF